MMTTENTQTKKTILVAGCYVELDLSTYQGKYLETVIELAQKHGWEIRSFTTPENAFRGKAWMFLSKVHQGKNVYLDESWTISITVGPRGGIEAKKNHSFFGSGKGLDSKTNSLSLIHSWLNPKSFESKGEK